MLAWPSTTFLVRDFVPDFKKTGNPNEDKHWREISPKFNEPKILRHVIKKNVTNVDNTEIHDLVSIYPQIYLLSVKSECV